MNALAANRLEVKMKPATQNQDTRIALLEQSNNHIYEALQRIEKRFDDVEKKLDKRFDEMDKKIDKFDSRLWTNFYWVLGSMATLTTIIAGLLAKGFHWFG